MQLRLEPAADLRSPGDLEGRSRHLELIARWVGRVDEDMQTKKAEALHRREMNFMGRAGWKLWIPDATRMCGRLGADAPRLLFVAGVPDLVTPAVAVVGTRRPDAYGLAMARRIGQALGRAGVVVVSGGALGVDAAAHEGALEVGGQTMAVLGGGLAMPHPSSHRDLFRRIAASSGGCVMSEAPCMATARRYSFPSRNRLLAALADAVVVVQAGVPSGALITAERARAMNVPVFAVPGDTWYLLSSGTLGLLQEGARPFGSPADLEVVPDLRGIATAPWPRPGSRPMGLPTPWAERTEIMPAAVGPDEEAVRAAIDRGERTVDALVAHLGLHAGRIQAALLGLEIAGEILVLPGGAVVPL